MRDQTPSGPANTPATPQPVRSIDGAREMSRASAADVYRAVKNERSELRGQLESLERKRSELSSTLSDSDTPAAAKAGLESRMKDVDARIVLVDQQIAQADAAVAKAASVPGAIVEPPPYVRNGPPEEIYAIPIVFTLCVLMPISIAYARRIWKRGATIVSPVPQKVQDRLDQLSEAVDSIGIEVERIGEGQRFMTRVLTDHNANRLGAGAAQPIAVPQRNLELATAPRAE